MTPILNTQSASDKCLMETNVSDGRPFVPMFHRNYCHNCSKLFTIGELWFWPSDMRGPHCCKCITDFQYENWQWQADMEKWAFMQEHGHDDPDMGPPSEPMYEPPF